MPATGETASNAAAPASRGELRVVGDDPAPGTEGLAGILYEFLRRQQALLKDRVRGQFVSVVRGDLVHPQDVLERLHPDGHTEEEVFG